MQIRRQVGEKKEILKDTCITLLILTAACIVSILLDMLGFNQYNMVMVYMVGTVVISLYVKHKAAGFASIIASIFLFNFFFTAPYHSLKVNDPGYIITFFMMFTTFMIVSNLVVKLRNNREEIKQKAYRTEVLFETSHKLQQAHSVSEIASWTARQLGQLLECDVYCFLGDPRKGEIYTYLAEREGEALPEKEEIAVAEWVYSKGRKAGAGTEILSGARCTYFAIRSESDVYAVAGVDLKGREIGEFEENLMLSMFNETGLAFEKERIRRKEQELLMELEREHFRTNILRAVSHDLRTPLTGISGNASMLLKNRKFMDDGEITRTCSDIYEDSIWLINMVENLLSVTRIENGTMKIDKKPELMDDIIAESVKHIKRHIGNRRLKVEMEDDMLVVNADAKLIIQVITNLVDNAVKHTKDNSEIIIRADANGRLDICDNGSGVADDQKEKIFDMFYTGNSPSADGRRGMGIGLSLCKSIINAHGGEIWVEDNQPCGSVFSFTLQKEEVAV